MKTKIALGFGVAAVAALFIASARAQEPPALAALANGAEHSRVAKLIAGAKKEGALEWVGVYSEPEQGKQILEAFKKQYGLPDLRTEYSYVGTGELIARINQLLRAGRNNFDIVWTSSWAWYKDLLKAGELLKYESPYYKEYTLSNAAGMSEDGYWVSDAYTQSPLYNIKALADRNIADFDGSSYQQLTNPKLKGLLALPDPFTSASTAQAFIGLTRVMGKDWLKRVAQNNPVLRVKSSQGRAWVASGEFPVTLGYAKDAVTLKASHVPVKLVYPKEGVVLLPFAPVILRRAPHPNAAKLFIDFVRSANGAQTVMDSGSAMLFGRPGVKSPDPEVLPAWEKIKVIPMKWDADATAAAIKAIRRTASEAGLR
jgi:iron(III) transport system substrate-binding protein